ncbi:MAG: discoidin domain-containing protein, partial [Methylocella sp.]
MGQLAIKRACIVSNIISNIIGLFKRCALASVIVAVAPSVLLAQTPTNIALNKPATASSVYSSAYLPSYAFDGNLNTRWSSQFSDPQWIYLDLGNIYNINEVKLTWEAAYGKAYQIQVSNDATNWTSIYSTTTGAGGVNDLTGLSGTGRYVRMYGTQRGTPWGYSLWEFEVYGTTGVTDTTPPTAPSNLVAAAAGTDINLSWTASTDNVGVTGYLVERCQGAGCTSFAQIATSPGTIYADTGLLANTSYSYRVRATDAANNRSGYSNTATATPATGGPVTQGQWSAELDPNSPGLPLLAQLNPTHAALLPNGKVLIVAGSGNCPPSQQGCPTGPPYGPSNGSGATLYDPVARTFTPFSVSWDMFCNSIVLLPDGRALINGGTTQYDPFHGAPKTSIFNSSTNTFTDVQNMAQGRWYPTVTTLADGRAMTFSGLDGSGNTTSLVEIYSVGSGWTQVSCSAPGANCWTPPLYPRMHLLPNGKVFYSGPTTSSALFDPSTLKWSLNVANTNYALNRWYGTSVLLPLTPANNYRPKVMIMGGYNPATATTETIDLGATNPTWQNGPGMSQPRIEMNAVILPNGKVLAVGGSAYDEDAPSASLNADLYDPATNTFSSGGANAYPRLYHSVALLLADATVWLAGGNPTRGSYEQRMEIYKPAYLFQQNGAPAVRPSIGGVPSSISL